MSYYEVEGGEKKCHQKRKHQLRLNIDTNYARKCLIKLSV